MDLFGNENQEIKALSWKEPFATLMLHEKIETRTWFTHYRGLVLICASKKPYKAKEIIEICEDQTKRIYNLFNSKGINEQPGKAIAIGRLSDCRLMTPEDEDKCFVKYRPGLYCHIYEDVKPIKAFDWKGAQGWHKVPKEIRKEIFEKRLKKPSLNEQILSYLKAGNSISSKKAYLKFGCLSLAARINNIRKDGYLQHNEIIEIVPTTENGKTFSLYSYLKF